MRLGEIQLRSQHGRETNGTCANNSNYIPRLDASVQHAHLIARGPDIGEHQHALVGNTGRDQIRGGVGEWNTHVLRLRAVDLVTEYPSASSHTEPVTTLTAEPASAAGT